MKPSMKRNRHLFPNKLLLIVLTLLTLLIVQIQGCQNSPDFARFQDAGYTVSAKCPDLILYPVNNVDTSDNYRFDYSDIGIGNTHSQGETVSISCTTGANDRPTVEGFDQQREAITSSANLIATCTNVGGSRYTWTIQSRVLQFVDCR